MSMEDKQVIEMANLAGEKRAQEEHERAEKLHKQHLEQEEMRAEEVRRQHLAQKAKRNEEMGRKRMRDIMLRIYLRQFVFILVMILAAMLVLAMAVAGYIDYGTASSGAAPFLAGALVILERAVWWH